MDIKHSFEKLKSVFTSDKKLAVLCAVGVLSSSMGDDTTGEVLDTLSSALTVINAAVIFTAALFIISTGIVISVKAGA